MIHADHYDKEDLIRCGHGNLFESAVTHRRDADG